MSHAIWYKLNDDGTTSPCGVSEINHQHINETYIGDMRVSTVFMSLDHEWGDGPPILFETMVFGGPLDQAQERYSTKQEAIEGHEKWVNKVKETEPPLKSV